MTTLIEDISSLLTTLAPAGGVWYGANTAEPPTWPYIVWQRIVSTPNVGLVGASDMQSTRIQIDILSRQISQAAAIETALEALMAASTIVNTPISSQDIYEFEVRAHRISKDYSVWAAN